MADLEQLRVKTGELLDEGLHSGALTVSEHSWRRTHLQTAESVDAMESLIRDLIEGDTPASPSSSQIAVLSNRVFHAPDLGRRSEVVTVMGSSRINLRGTDPAAERRLEVVTIMGETVIEVPEDQLVRLDCPSILGDILVPDGMTSEDAPLVISGAVILGSLRLIRVKTHGTERR